MKQHKDLFEKKLLQGVYDEAMAYQLQQEGPVDEYLQKAKALSDSLAKIKDSLDEQFGQLPDIVTTVGVYPNGPSKVNAVSKEDLLYHIHYNLTNRGGRGLIVHNKIFYKGFVDDKKLQEELVLHGSKVFETDSAPYH